jgi:hypothetical protein
VGVPVGNADGIVVGTPVGEDVGTIECEIVGVVVGTSVGDTVGNIECASVGGVVGTLVGVPVGMPVVGVQDKSSSINTEPSGPPVNMV